MPYTYLHLTMVAALLVIDYEPTQLEAVRSMDHDLLVENAISPR
jgi:hypothetical protein